MADINTTLSCSFQLVLARARNTGNDLADEGEYAADLIRQCLAEPMSASCISCGTTHTFRIPVNTIGYLSNPTKWNVEQIPPPDTYDNEIDEAKATLTGLTINTPVFFTKVNTWTTVADEDPEHTHQVRSTATIAAVLQHLCSRLGQMPTADSIEPWLYVSPNCRFGVEVDNAGLGFLNSTYERVQKAVETCSRQIDMLHRGQGFVPPKDDNTAAHTPSCHSSSTAITFDQAPPTLIPSEALACVDVCEKLVARCAKSDDSYIDWQLGNDGDFASPAFTASDFLYALECSKECIVFYDRYNTSRRATLEDDVAKAMLAVTAGNILGPLSLYVANTALGESDARHARERVRRRLKDGTYGEFSEMYTKMAIMSRETDS